MEKLYYSRRNAKKNNYPLVQIHSITKIMCQDLALGCLYCLLVCAVQNRNFGYSARFYIFCWNVNDSDSLCTVLLYKLFIFPNFGRFWGKISIVNVQIATNCSVFDRFCFWCIVCLFRWNYQFLSVD